MDIKDLENRFAFHPATTAEKQMAHGSVRDIMLGAAIRINELLPEGREKSLAVTHLEEAMFWGNAGLARANSVGAEQLRLF